MSDWRRPLGISALIAVGATIGVAAERIWVKRQLAATSQQVIVDAPHTTEILSVVADDGARLHVEVDTPAHADADTPTVLLAHGFGMGVQSWWPQRRALRGVARVIVWDHRGHGKSAEARNPQGPPIVIDRLAADMATILDLLAPGNVICAGHSMGGMTIMALAQLHPEWFGTRIKGVVLLGTSPGDIAQVTLGLPAPAARWLRRLIPVIGAATSHEGPWVELSTRIRRSSSDAGLVLARTYAFGDTVPSGGPELVSRLINDTPAAVVGDLLIDVHRHDRLDALETLREVPVLIVVGTRDLLTPVAHSRAMARALPLSRLVELAGVGHMLGLEQAQQINELLLEFVASLDEGAIVHGD